MEFEYQKLLSDNIVMVENKQFAVDCRVNDLLDENVSKIIALDASSKVDNYDVLEGEITLKGKLNYRLLYIDNMGEIRSLNYLCDYEDTINAKVNVTDKIFIDSEVKSVASSGLDIIRLSAIVGVKIYKVDSVDYDIIANNLPSCYYKTSTVKKQDYVTTISSPFDLEDEALVKENILDILMLDSKVNLLDAVPSDNKITLSGEGIVDVTYKTESGIHSQKFNIPFNEEIEGASTSTSNCYSKLVVDNTKVVLGDEDKLLKVKMSVDSRSVVFNPSEIEVVNDMYSMTNNLKLENNNIEVDSFSCYKNFSERINVEATLKEDLNGEIIGVICPKNKVASVRKKEDETVVEGVVSACLLFKRESAVSSLNIEAPYKVALDLVDELIDIDAIVQDIAGKLKTDNTIMLDIYLKFSAKCKENTCCNVVVNAEDTGMLSPKSAISIIVIDKPKTFFDVAKMLATTPEELASQNPNLQEPLTLGDRLYYYRQLANNLEECK